MGSSEPIREVWNHYEAFAKRLSMMRVMTSRMTGNSGSRVTLEVLGKTTAAAGFQSSSEIAEVSGNKSGNDISY